MSKILKAFKSADGFIVNGVVCGDWSFPGKDEEEADSIAFYLYGSHGLTEEVFVDTEALIQASFDNNMEVVVKSLHGKDVSICPLFKKEVIVSDIQKVSFPLGEKGAVNPPVATVEKGSDGLWIGVSGYSNATDEEGEIILLDWFEDKLSLKVWADINNDDRTHDIPLSGALNSERIEDAN